MTGIGVAVIGCGRMGLRRIRRLDANPAAELRVVADADVNRAEAVARPLGVASCTDWNEAIHFAGIDAVVVSTPNFTHKEIVMGALAAGCHVFCEKPLAVSVEDAREMVASARESGRQIQVGSHLRYFANVKKAKELLDGGAIGNALTFRGMIGHDGWNLGHDSWFRNANLSGGGTFIDNGPHLLDIARWMMGEIVSGTGLIQTGRREIAPLEDFGVGIFRTTRGQTITIQSSWNEWDGYFAFEIYGEAGLIRVDNRGQRSTTELIFRDKNRQFFDYSELPPSSYDEEVDTFIDALRTMRPSSPSGEDGQRVVEMVAAVYRGAIVGSHITLGGC